MTAPVSLAAIKARKASLFSGLIGMTEAERDALVELACEAMTRRPIADTPAPQPPATDPHDGWTPLVEGCAMPEHEKIATVTVSNSEATWIDTAMFSGGVDPYFVTSDGTTHDGERWANRRMDDEEGPLRLTAWRPAPAPYRGGK